MRFYDREKELHVLGEVLHRSKSEAKMTVLMGRRRIGKTELSLRCGDETVLYFFVGKKAETLLCQDYVREIREKLNAPILGTPNTFSEVFRFVLQLSENRPSKQSSEPDYQRFGVHANDQDIRRQGRTSVRACR